jgi:hypothetical protein
VSFGLATMVYVKLAFILLCSVICGCSTSDSTGSIGSSGIRFDHRAEALSGHKTALTVIATNDAPDSRVSVDREARAYADRYATRACPKGHEFYTDAPMPSAGNERTFVFGCS